MTSPKGGMKIIFVRAVGLRVRSGKKGDEDEK